MFTLSSLTQVIIKSPLKWVTLFLYQIWVWPLAPKHSNTPWALADHHAEGMEIFILKPSSECTGTVRPLPPSHREYFCLLSCLWEQKEGKHSFPTASSFPLWAPGICRNWGPFKDWMRGGERNLLYLTHCGFYCAENQFCRSCGQKVGPSLSYTIYTIYIPRFLI